MTTKARLVVCGALSLSALFLFTEESAIGRTLNAANIRVPQVDRFMNQVVDEAAVNYLRNKGMDDAALELTQLLLDELWHEQNWTNKSQWVVQIAVVASSPRLVAGFS